MRLLPRDEAKGVDWVAALRQGIIDPRWGVKSEDSTSVGLVGFGFDFNLKGPDAMFDAWFPHSSHVQWVACQSCHGEIFRYRNEPITMDAVNSGEACGRCHGPVAFPVSTCVRCHRDMPVFEERADPLGQDLILPRPSAPERVEGGTPFPRARFPHWTHRIRYRCAACHPTRFAMRVGADTLTMDAMRNGAACGACHDGQSAFGLLECNRCHVPPPQREGP